MQRLKPAKKLCMQGFSEASDVWSLGVLLSELFSQGKMPYAELGFQEVREFVVGGQVLTPPSHTPHDLKNLMLTCWDLNPKQRPKFKQILNELRSMQPDQPSLPQPSSRIQNQNNTNARELYQ